MSDEWRATLESALTAHGVSLAGLGGSYAEAGLEVPQWLLPVDGPKPSPAEYLILSDLTGIETEVLDGEVPPTQTLLAMRSRGQTAPDVAVSRSLDLLRVARAVTRLEPHGDRLQSIQALQEHFAAPPPVNTYDARKAGERAAMQVRARLSLGLDPILGLAGLVEDLGVAVEASIDLPKGLHGVTAWTRSREGWIAVVTVNASDYWTVQRYTLAHEFCHVLHQDRPDDLTTELEGEDITSSPEEHRAEGFAATLLVPTSGLAAHWRDSDLGNSDHLNALAQVMWHWGLSRKAACIALQNCNQVPWDRDHTDAAGGTPVASLMTNAGFANEWADMSSTEGLFEPSTWLVEASADLFLQSRLPPEHAAVVSREDEHALLRRLLTVD